MFCSALLLYSAMFYSALSITVCELGLKGVIYFIGSGFIEFEEFLTMLPNHMANTEDELRQAFLTFDKDKSGKINADELRHVLLSVGDKLEAKDVDELMKQGDINQDGEIDYEGINT